MPDPIDITVGRNLRARRHEINMTQTALAAAMGVKFQQVQKYETAANRIAASRLWHASIALGVPVEAFFRPRAPESEARRHAD